MNKRVVIITLVVGLVFVIWQVLMSVSEQIFPYEYKSINTIDYFKINLKMNGMIIYYLMIFI